VFKITKKFKNGNYNAVMLSNPPTVPEDYDTHPFNYPTSYKVLYAGNNGEYQTSDYVIIAEHGPYIPIKMVGEPDD